MMSRLMFNLRHSASSHTHNYETTVLPVSAPRFMRRGAMPSIDEEETLTTLQYEGMHPTIPSDPSTTQMGESIGLAPVQEAEESTREV